MKPAGRDLVPAPSGSAHCAPQAQARASRQRTGAHVLGKPAGYGRAGPACGAETCLRPKADSGIVAIPQI
jgi:hypothetical protein